MKKCANWISNHSLLIVIISCLLLIPSIYGYNNTKINYDILSYLPEDIETIKGQEILTNEFDIGSFTFILTDSKNNQNLLKLEEKIKKIEGVNQVFSIADLADASIPIEMLPSDLLEKVYQGEKTLILVTFHTAISDETTTNAIETLRNMVAEDSISGMSAMVLDTANISKSEMSIYILLSVLFCFIVLIISTDSYLIPIFLLGNIGFAILYNMGSNIFLGQISYITEAITAVLQLGVTMDFSIFLYHKYEQNKKTQQDKKKAMTEAIKETFHSVIGSSFTTIAGFLALCAMSLALGSDIGLVMAKGVVCGLICVLTLFPALLLVFDKYVEKTKHKVIMPNFQKMQNFAIKYHKYIIIVFLIILIPAIIGNKNVEVYYKLDESLSPSTLRANVVLPAPINVIFSIR